MSLIKKQSLEGNKDIFDVYFKAYKNLFTLLGWWPYQKLYQKVLLNIFHITTNVSLLIFQMKFVYVYRRNLDTIIADSNFCISTVLMLMLIANNYINQNVLRRLNDDIKDYWEHFKHINCDHEIMQSRTSLINKMLFVCRVLAMLMFIFFCMVPLAPKFLDFVKPLNKSRPVHFILDYNISVYFSDKFYMVYGYNIICMVSCFLQYNALFAAILVLASYLCATFSMIGSKLERIENGFATGNMRDLCTRKVKNELRFCVKYHKHAIEFGNITDTYFQLVFGSGIILNVFALSTALYLLLLTVETQQRVTQSILIAIFPFEIMYLYCFGGEVAMRQSAALKNVCYNTKWYSWPPTMRKIVHIIQCRCNKPFHISCFGFAVASLEFSLKDGRRLFVGAPGSWYWQGQLYSIDSRATFPYSPPEEFYFSGYAEGQVYSRAMDNRTKIMYTKEGPASEDDSYMGYSVTTGDFVGNGDSGTAVGVPRGSDLRGKVVLLTSQMMNHQNITGEQMGAYFGYSVAAGDIDGDGLDDLIIGAPMYTIPGNTEMTIETGRVYVVYQGRGPDKFRKVHSRDGTNDRGRFGLSLTSLGDIDLDGYGDFAVGAPYAGPEGRGVVYIFYGSQHGVLEKYSQAIYAEQLEPPVNTFGFSLAGSLDLDGNRYPDLAVGSYESSTAMFFRARPVIKMDSFVEFGSETKLIALDDNECVLSDRTPVTCLPLKACFKFSGERALQRHNFDIQFVLDVKKMKNPRLFFLELEGRNTMNHTISVEKDLQFCRTVKVYVAPNIRDKLTSLDAEMRMSLSEESLPDTRPRDPRVQLRPVLARTTSRKDAVFIRKNCGPDNVCIPDLHMIVQPNVDRYLLGSGRRLELDVLVENRREDGFEAMFTLQLPTGIDYIKIERIDRSEIPVLCSAPKQSNNHTLRCDIGNPLPQGKLVHFLVLLHPVTSHSMKPTYEFKMAVNTTNPEDQSTVEDNTLDLTLPIWIETELLVEGESKPKELYYNPDNYTSENVTTDVEFGPQIIHNYTIRNQGPSEILEAEAYLVWPAQTLAGDELLYLVEQPETTGPIACETANANYLSLKLEQRRRPQHYYMEPSGVYVEESDTGKTINVQRGFGFNEPDRRKDTDRQDRDHRTREYTSTITSQTRKVQIGSEGVRPGAVTSVYQHNTSGSGSSTTHDHVSATYPSVIISTESTVGSFSGGTTGFIIPTKVEENTIRIGAAQGRGIWEHNRNESRTFENRYGTSTEVYVGSSNEGSRYDELRRQQEQRILEQQLLERRREEAKRVRLEEERRLEQERWRIEEEKIAQRRREEQERKWKEEKQSKENSYDSREYVYGKERHFTTEEEDARRNRGGYGYGTEKHVQSTITGDREDSVGSSDLVFRLRNITSAQDMDKFYGSLSSSTTSFTSYKRQGKLYVQFLAKFQVSSDGREFVEFKNGLKIPLEDRDGRDSYVEDIDAVRSGHFIRMEGQPMFGPDGKIYIILKDGRRFAMQGSYTYTEERTYRFGGGDGTATERSYGTSWHEESSNVEGNVDNKYETSYSSRTHEERRVEKSYGRRTEASYEEEEKQIRHRRRSDAIDVDRFLELEKSHRVRRDVASQAVGPQGASPDHLLNDFENEQQRPPCKAARCVVLRCVLGPLEKDQEVSIATRHRINARTLKKVAFNEPVKISTELIARVTRQPFIGTPNQPVVKSHEIYTNVQPTAPPAAPDVVPLWVVVLSACAGTIILLLLIYLLYKCGFFKRNRPTDMPERQPLNGNGHY